MCIRDSDWPAHSAMSSHDALMVASGITTVLDAVAIGDVRDGGDRLENLEKMINAIEETQKRGVNRAEHRLHLRCELPHHTTLPLFEKLVQREPVTLVSLMDHSPGQRQFANREKYREYYQGKYSLTDAQMQQYDCLLYTSLAWCILPINAFPPSPADSSSCLLYTSRCV